MPLAAGAAGVVVLWPLDGPAMDLVRRAPLGGDVKRELEALQQYGQLAFSLIIAAVVFILDPANRRRLLDWLAAGIAAALVSNGLKYMIARPRPSQHDPAHIVGLFGSYPVRRGDGSYVMETGFSGGYALASMPSRHAVFAVLSSVVLATIVPRLRWLFVGLALLVCIARVWTQAHYPTDVVAGAALGLIAGGWAVHHKPGQSVLRLLRRKGEE